MLLLRIELYWNIVTNTCRSFLTASRSNQRRSWGVLVIQPVLLRRSHVRTQIPGQIRMVGRWGGGSNMKGIIWKRGKRLSWLWYWWFVAFFSCACLKLTFCAISGVWRWRKTSIGPHNTMDSLDVQMELGMTLAMQAQVWQCSDFDVALVALLTL